MFPFEFIIVLAAFTFLGFAFLFKDFVFGAVSGMLFMVYGVFVATNGVAGINNFMTQALAVVVIGVGAYVFIRGGIEALRQGE